ncbi:caspase family protein [Micromonospora sp. CPCC 206060]|uniref:HD domain-containing protein n=1 Tax=Micromonospora sp. CPCC 206060 TaxID=3122406 RepID=UPI002FEEE7B8
MTDRLALLIGVPGCENSPLEVIPESVVRADVTRMRDVLLDSGYAVTVLGAAPEAEAGETAIRQPASRGLIIGQIKEACRGVPVGGTVLVYFSGHGVNLDGKDWLIPTDGHWLTADEEFDPDTLVPLDPARYLDRCPARLVLFVVDACRDGGGEFGGQALAATRAPVAARPANGVFALLAGCSPHEVCRYDEQGSFFTQTLADILDKRHPAQTVNAVFAHVKQRMLRRSRRSDGPHQEPQLSIALSDADQDTPAGLPICAGEQVFEAWQEAVRQSPLWQLCTDVPADRVEHLREGLAELVEEYARQWRDAQELLTSRSGLTDPWTDHDYPVRVTGRLAQLLDVDGDTPPRLSPAEAGLLVAAPFLREAVLAEGLAEAAMSAPTDFRRTHAPGPRSDLEITHSIHQHMCHRAEGLAARGRTAERDALAMWLVHRWVTGRQDLWDSSRTAELCRRLAARLLDEPADGSGPWTTELSGVLAGLVPCLGTAISTLSGDELTGCAVPQFRSPALGGVLSLAGVLAVDVRRLDPVVADHVGIRDALDLDELRTNLSRLYWEGAAGPSGRGLDLRTVCTHPAVHRALLEVAERAEQSRAAAVRLASRPGVDARLFAAFPVVVTAEGITPAGTGVRNERRYEKELPRFRLSDDKIKELLMGRQLYGDPALALRELYQNALDACRYRQMRRRYLLAKGVPAPEWHGRIIFTQGVEDGQPFIECTDNGVGMDADTLKNTFAQAGQRFVHRDAFRREQARWQRVDPELRLIPNSQFGIGVFSYFMLADEISIRTRATNEYAEAVGDTLRIDISSSGSLFRIRRDHGVPDGGTSVRLLLTGEEKVSVRRTLDELILLPEFDLEIREEGRQPERWPAGELRYIGGDALPVRVTDRVWWVAGRGGLTADGIQTDETGHGYVVDLRDRQRPRFTVDRRTLRDWDRDWVAGALDEGLPHLVGWPGLTLRWLWTVAESKPEVAQQVYDYLVAHGVTVPMGGELSTDEVDPAQVGCFPGDDSLLTAPESLSSHYAPWLWAWRRAAWSMPPQFDDWALQPICVDGHPVPDALDGFLLSQFLQSDQNVVSVRSFVGIVADSGWRPAQVYRRMRRFVIAGLDLRALRTALRVDLDRVPSALLAAVLSALNTTVEPDPPVAVLLVRASIRESLSIREVLDQLRPWLPPDNPIALLDSAELADDVCTSADLALLSRDLDGKAPWIPLQVPLAHLSRAANNNRVSVDEVWESLLRWAPLGYQLPDRKATALSLSKLEQEILRGIAGQGPARLSRWWLHNFAGPDRSIRTIFDQLSRLVAQGLVDLPAVGTVPDLVPDATDRAFVGRRGFGREDNWQTTARIIAALIAPGPAWAGTGRPGQPALIAALARSTGPLTAPQLFALAESSSLPPAACMAELRRHGLVDEVDPLATALVEASAEDCPTEWDVILLCVEQGHDIVWRTRLAPAWVVRHAFQSGSTIANTMQMAACYRSLGAPVLELPADLPDACAGLRPDAVDLALLPEADDRDEPVSAVTALHLVREAGRLGLTPPEAQQRLDRYAPLGLTFDYDPAAVPDGVVRWQDLILLSAHFDGYEPTVGPVVPDAHIERCADLTGETPAWVRTRLRHYAPMFDLTVPPEEDPVD